MAQRLGQAELLEAPPSRRLIVPRGHCSWWGVDPSTQRCAIGVVSPLEDGFLREQHMVSFPTLAGGRRLAVICGLVMRLAYTIARTSPPGVVVVEQPSGKTPNLELVYATGVILAALSEGVSRETGHVIQVETVPSKKWKRVACGRGDIRKPKPSERDVYEVLRWARALGYGGSSWDEADAWGVADYARRTFALEER